MLALLRMLLVATALLSSGALQVAAVGDDVCCAGDTEENDASCPDCPPGLACACCTIRGALQSSVLDVAPATSPAIALAVASTEPTLGGSVTDIFHPPRA